MPYTGEEEQGREPTLPRFVTETLNLGINRSAAVSTKNGTVRINTRTSNMVTCYTRFK